MIIILMISLLVKHVVAVTLEVCQLLSEFWSSVITFFSSIHEESSFVVMLCLFPQVIIVIHSPVK